MRGRFRKGIDKKHHRNRNRGHGERYEGLGGHDRPHADAWFRFVGAPLGSFGLGGLRSRARFLDHAPGDNHDDKLGCGVDEEDGLEAPQTCDDTSQKRADDLAEAQRGVPGGDGTQCFFPLILQGAPLPQRQRNAADELTPPR